MGLRKGIRQGNGTEEGTMTEGSRAKEGNMTRKKGVGLRNGNMTRKKGVGLRKGI